ncbi:uncharacterized protein LOC119724841 [Patiria miniata]|uniref:Uncharacterized protein n=1 Tax=Patiria miniata TaxID=46514 RepID=A0A913ZLQ2_PATMI|nr:uncharacterized protein LOC119724841 [Patiria miniata]
MERRQAPVQVLFRVKGPLQQPTNRQSANRGRYGPSNRLDYRPRGGPGGAEFRVAGSGGGLKYSTGPGAVGGRGGGGGGRRTAPANFVRNPKFPKSLYDVEMSMRQVYKNKPLKITPGMSFPDPKSNRSISNPRAPRFEYEYEPSREDYNIIHNPMAGAEDESEMMAGGLVRERYIDAVAYGSDSDTDSDTPDGQFIKDDDSEVSDADDADGDVEGVMMQQQAQMEVEQLYAHTRPKAHRVREAQLLETEPPAFEPQPPPPRAPVDPVLVIPRAIVREEELQREQRYGSRNGAASTSTPDDNNNGME